MKLAIMQPYFLPYIGYWQMIKAVDTYVIYDDVNFIKGGWINRNRMLLGGTDFMFNLELKGASPNKLINQIEVGDNQSKIIRTIAQAYAKAPQYAVVMPLIERLFDYAKSNLGYFLGNSIVEIAKYLKIDTTFIYSSDIEKDNSLKAQDKVISISKALFADSYYNAIGGQELYSVSDFKSAGIELKFLQTLPIEYAQLKNDFLPCLSILDVLMFNTVEQINEMLDQYELL